MTAADRLMKYVELTESGCWHFTGGKNKRGYGNFYFDGRGVCAHRAAHLIFIGPIPDGYTVDHLCGNPSCVNPAHLEAVTQRENLMRGNTRNAHRARQTHCKRGHEFTAENTYREPRRGCRVCRTCHRDYERERRRRMYVHVDESDIRADLRLVEGAE